LLDLFGSDEHVLVSNAAVFRRWPMAGTNG